jgi:hypothetical protein
MIKIFVLASGRSGTNFLSDLFKYNIKNCVNKHEPFPDMFGSPIYWYLNEKTENIRKKFLIKKNRITHYKKAVYIETNHAFLKSFCDVAMEFFPDMKLIHLIRNPLKVVKSELNKQIIKNKTHFLFHYYKGEDGGKYVRWALTGLEDIFKDVNIEKITLYQKYVLQWIEIENRAMKFLNKYNKEKDCYTLFVPEDINNHEVLLDMFRFFKLEQKKEKIIIRGSRNLNLIPTKVTDEDRRQMREVVNNLPESYLKIFQKEPYTKSKWIKLLMKDSS